MPNSKKSDQTTTGQSGNKNQKNKTKNATSHGMQPGAMPHIPTASERAKEMDSNRRMNAETFEL